MAGTPLHFELVDSLRGDPSHNLLVLAGKPLQGWWDWADYPNWWDWANWRQNLELEDSLRGHPSHNFLFLAGTPLHYFLEGTPLYYLGRLG